MTTNLTDIIRKIKALRARAADSASSETEVAKATAVADKLLQEYNIDLSELDVRADGVVKTVWGGGRRARGAETFAALHIAKATNTEAWVQNGGEIVYLGSPADVEVALYYTDLVSNAATACWKAYQKTDAYNTQTLYHSSRKVGADFRRGLCSRVGRRIADQVQLEKTTATGAGLVVVKNALINQWLQDNGLRFRSHKRTTGVGQSYNAGQDAGNSVAIGRGVGFRRSSVLALG
jgi:hypothetical protein